ncbi:glycosyltransferase family 2 protein [Rhizosaccharibacter radicis]|uniref:Glycosyltransferase n=1 Tax=Rhizosaccharibacter radicis TaxID=2782605 RepID=A0ABT1W0C7_9PROT|nr:glycosyltransferase [Acetobacteraceae bacterium KSS12]
MSETRVAHRVVPAQQGLLRRQQPPDFFGYFDSCDGAFATGWAYDRAAPLEPVTLHVLIDKQEVGTVVCDILREDVQQAFNHPTGLLGFRFPIPVGFIDGQPHQLSFRFANRMILPFIVNGDSSDLRDGIEFTLERTFEFQSFIDGMKQGALRGWVQKVDPHTGERLGNCQVLVTSEGLRVAQVRANRYRGDVAAALGGDPNCGFEIILPKSFRQGGQRTFRFIVTPDDVELSGSPLTTTLVDDALEASLIEINARVERLYGEISKLRNDMGNVMPKPSYNLGDYDRWARRYYDRLRARVSTERAKRAIEKPDAKQPLVSILVPTYKPMMSDFTAAVDSVLSQTYANWELIIVDDGAKSPEIAERIRKYCEQDPRIRAVTLKKNRGISGATNAGLEAVKGEYVAFFDHDDLLVDVAIEMMVNAAQDTGARMLYSDEDKIDQAGYYLEPNLKPDYNYRYLLGCNYICHLLFVEASLLRKVGPLRTDYDGAQDHDLILRLVEEIAPSDIHHVPEVLYHWRKTPNSTAVNIGNKTYAIDAGVRCVGDHLTRRGVKAKVSSIRGLTLYGIEWLNRKQPSVSVIIPFKDQVETTEQCLNTLLANTDYKKLDVVLVNNWSITKEAEAFCRRAEKLPNVRVLTVEEEFNYSRLNNLACRDNPADFFFFMNNDVFVSDPKWLKTIVGEALSAPDIAAVGGKFLYPNDTIQHAGVVVGPAGVAAHVHRGAPLTDYGYIGRALLSHEVTAVTAAGMLLRADVFRAVGGFDEEHLKVAYNDVDLCLKIRSKGYRIVWCAEFTAYHHESLSRGSDDRPEHEARFYAETRTMQERWGLDPQYRRDPFYSKHFTVDRQPFFDLVDPAAEEEAAA